MSSPTVACSYPPTCSVPLEDAERPRDDQVPAEPVPAETTEQERPQVLDDLKSDERLPGCAHSHDGAGAHHAAVGDANGPPGGDEVVSFEERADHPHQGVPLDEGVGVDRAHEVARCDVQSSVEGVGLAAVRLVDDDQRRLDR